MTAPPEPSPASPPPGPQDQTASKPSQETWIALLAGLGILMHLVARYAAHASSLRYNAPLLAVLILGGAPLLWGLLRRVLKLEFGADLLAGVSIAASLALQQYLAGSIIVLMLSGGNALEQFAMRRASTVLAALAKRMPRLAHKFSSAGMSDVDLDQLALGDRLAVFPHEICPVDGVVLEGRSTMDESYLTGEPFFIAKLPGAEVLSGAVNGEGALTISVAR